MNLRIAGRSGVYSAVGQDRDRTLVRDGNVRFAIAIEIGDDDTFRLEAGAQPRYLR